MANPRPQLYVLHRTLIIGAAVLSIMFAVFSVARYRSTGDSSAHILAWMSGAVAIALGTYLKWFWKKSA
jgi:hypothetical protein